MGTLFCRARHGALGLLLTAVCLSAATSGHAREDDDIDNVATAVGIGALVSTTFGGTVAGIFAPWPASAIGDGVGIASNISLKAIPAPLEIPSDRAFFPNSSDGCSYHFSLPQSIHKQADIFAVPLGLVPTNWGALGTPDTAHGNSEVVLMANNRYIDISGEEQTVRMPAGEHSITWQAHTLLDPVFDIALPTALALVSGHSKRQAAIVAAKQANNAKEVAKAAGFFKTAGRFLVKKLKLAKQCVGDPKCMKSVAKKGAVAGSVKGSIWAADKLTGFELINATHQRTQAFTVYDTRPPRLTLAAPRIELEATDFGGVVLARVRDALFAGVTHSDQCQRPSALGHDLPPLLPIGQTVINWEVSDLGPTGPSGGVNVVRKPQTVVVKDTQAPIMVPPPGKVYEVPAGRTGLGGGNVDLGVPLVVDLADPTPTIRNDKPNFFPVDTRTTVTWTAADKALPSPNVNTKQQLITVKRQGTNTAPRVSSLGRSTLTSQPIDIVLGGTDTDRLGGRVDPLGFEIVDRPKLGEFVAPLYPYFIEDYRTRPDGPFGDDYPTRSDARDSGPFRLTNNRPNWLYDNVCNGRPRREIPVDWVHDPVFVQVADDGSAFFLDHYWDCQASFADRSERISKWSADGDYLGQYTYSGTNDSFVADRDGLLYTQSRVGGGSSVSLSLAQLRPDFDVVDRSRAQLDFWRFRSGDGHTEGSGPRLDNSNFAYARVDSQRGLIYINDRKRIGVFDVREDLADPERNSVNGMQERFLGLLNDGQQTLGGGNRGSSWTGYAMEVDSAGALYVADGSGNRVHKFAPSGFDGAGNFQPGEYVGWMGRCATSTNKACDEDTQTAKGYICTDATCTVEERQAPDFIDGSRGDQPGQFNNPIFLAIDPNDTLYVADFENSRVQRFAPDGTFAGQAVSTGTGVNNGDAPGFVLGNMGQPKAVSVNSTQFYVVDTDESFVHVFETSPFKDVTDKSVTVTYVSEFDTHSQTDNFTYAATDGLAYSNVGSVDVRVDRNFRAPLAFDSDASTLEDTAVTVRLVADDPDGILGKDARGLDTLTYEIVEGPANGTLSGTGETRTYMPARDYAGTDRIAFRVNDGRENSTIAEVLLDVEPVDDPPLVTALNLPERIGRGFPVILEGLYTDDGAAEHRARVEWGSGEGVEVTGEVVDPDGEDGPEPPELRGIAVIEPDKRIGQGRAIGQHIYENTGVRRVRYCMADENGRQTCLERGILVESLVALDVTVEAAKAAANGRFPATLTIENVAPVRGAGRTANSVTLVQEATPDLRVVGVATTSRSHCSNPGGRLSCDFGSLPSGSSVTVAFSLAATGSRLYDRAGVFSVVVDTPSSTVASEYRATETVDIAAFGADSDGDGLSDLFERTYNVASASVDDDGDGLSNLEEFRRQTHPRRVDSDGDGLNDREEGTAKTDPNAADTDGDGLPDGYEASNALEPRYLEDAALDADGDGLSNTREFQLGTSPQLADSDNDGARDDRDNCRTTANRDQGNLDRDGRGDACDDDDDNDGMTDAYELANQFDPRNAADGSADADGDGLNNAAESRFGTNPRRRDTDGDGRGDREEFVAAVVPSILEAVLE